MKNYRLKKEAVPFFHEKYATAIHPLEKWQSICVDEKALEEVVDCFATFGHKTSENSSSLSGWAGPRAGRPIEEQGSYFHFTLHFPSVKFGEHDRFAKGKYTRQMMDRITAECNRIYLQFNNNPETDDFDNDED